VSERRHYPRLRESEAVAHEIGNAAAADSWDEIEELLHQTDCPHGCYVEPDGFCPHGWKSGALSAGMSTSGTRTAVNSSASSTGTRTRGSPASGSARRSDRNRLRPYRSLPLVAEHLTLAARAQQS
jgi:hypothetical protein